MSDRLGEGVIIISANPTHLSINKDYLKDIEAENRKLKTALQNLVNLKEYKDKNGKDAHYLREQPKAWKMAKDALP